MKNLYKMSITLGTPEHFFEPLVVIWGGGLGILENHSSFVV